MYFLEEFLKKEQVHFSNLMRYFWKGNIIQHFILFPKFFSRRTRSFVQNASAHFDIWKGLDMMDEYSLLFFLMSLITTGIPSTTKISTNLLDMLKKCIQIGWNHKSTDPTLRHRDQLIIGINLKLAINACQEKFISEWNSNINHLGLDGVYLPDIFWKLLFQSNRTSEMNHQDKKLFIFRNFQNCRNYFHSNF